MITLKVLSGPYHGEARRFSGDLNLDRKVQMDPMKLLTDLVRGGSVWEIDFSVATSNEVLLWGRADMAARIIRAASANVPIQFIGIDFVGLSEIENLEDAIVNSGLDVFVAVDNGKVLVIGHRGILSED